MSLNIGKGVEAARSLVHSAAWRDICEALREQARSRMNQALDAPPGNRDDAIGYARALRDVYVAFEAATLGVPHAQVKKPGALAEKR